MSELLAAYATGALVLAWSRWWSQIRCDHPWQDAIEIALWPLALPYATWRGR